jgi:hypothetical protein
MPYANQWRQHLRLQASILPPSISKKYTPVQDLESKQLVHTLLSHPDRFSQQFHRYASSLIFSLAYGKRMVTGEEEEVHAINKIMRNFVDAGQVGRWLVDAFPILDYTPQWLAEWKKLGAKYHEYESNLHIKNLREASEREGWNWAKQYLRSEVSKNMSELEIGYDCKFPSLPFFFSFCFWSGKGRCAKLGGI